MDNKQSLRRGHENYLHTEKLKTLYSFIDKQ